MRFEMKNAKLDLAATETKEGVKREAKISGSIDLVVEMSAEEMIQMIKEEGEVVKQLLQMLKK